MGTMCGLTCYFQEAYALLSIVNLICAQADWSPLPILESAQLHRPHHLTDFSPFLCHITESFPSDVQDAAMDISTISSHASIALWFFPSSSYSAIAIQALEQLYSILALKENPIFINLTTHGKRFQHVPRRLITFNAARRFHAPCLEIANSNQRDS
jgi:hypothetical protein